MRWVRAVEAEQGSITAEFAVALPAVVLVLALCLGCVQALGRQLLLVDGAARAARLLARGDDPAPVLAALQVQLGPVALGSDQADGLSCVELRSPAGSGPIALLGIQAAARSCAYAG